VERVGEHLVPAGPLAVRWLAYELEPVRAGALAVARLAFENAGSAAWRQTPGERIHLSYHWLDPLGNPIVWDGLWRPLERQVEPGERVDLRLHVRGPRPPARYTLAFDLVDEARCWFADVGSTPLALAVEVLPRIPRRTLAAAVRPGPEELVRETHEALARQEERVVDEQAAAATAHLAAGCVPARDWSRRILDGHAEGFAAVGGSIDPLASVLDRTRLRRELAPWAPGSGRNPNFDHPLLCPSLVADVEPTWLDDVAGLPAIERPREEPWLYDGRIVVRARLRSGRRPA
jgi:hypothetical protein